jgi:hypothetical protein
MTLEKCSELAKKITDLEMNKSNGENVQLGGKYAR